MENIYLKKIESLLNHSYPQLSTKNLLTFKNSFGAVAGYVKGNIFISCGEFGVALKLPLRTLERLFRERGVKRLKYFSKGHIKKEYAVLPERIIRDTQKFRKLIELSLDYTSDNNY